MATYGADGVAQPGPFPYAKVPSKEFTMPTSEDGAAPLFDPVVFQPRVDGFFEQQNNGRVSDAPTWMSRGLDDASGATNWGNEWRVVEGAPRIGMTNELQGNPNASLNSAISSTAAAPGTGTGEWPPKNFRPRQS